MESPRKTDNLHSDNFSGIEATLAKRESLEHLPLSIKQSQITVSVADKSDTVLMRNGIPQWRLKALEVYICICTLINGYDVSNIANIQASIYSAFGQIETLPWVALSYSLVCTATAPLVSRLLNLGNIRITMLFFFSLFIISCAISGSANSMIVVAVGRALTGLANTGVYQMNLNLVSLLYSPTEASRIGGMVGMSWAIGLIIGPFVGGGFALNSSTSWRWAFYILTPFLGVLMLVAILLLPNHNPRRGSSLQQAICDIDWLGGFLHAGVVILFALAVVQSGSSWSWNSGSAITSWVVMGVATIAYITQQYSAFLTTPMRRAFPVTALVHRTAGLAAVAVVCTSTSYAVSLYYLPLFFAFARRASPIGAAIHIIPFIGVFIIAVIVSSILMPKLGYYAPFYVVAGAMMVIGGSLMAQITPATHNSVIMGFQSLIGFGVGLVFSNSYSVANASLHDPEARLSSAALFNIASMGGIALALVIAGCIYQNVGFRYLHSTLKPFGFDDRDIREALSGLASPILHSDNSALQDAVVHNVTKVIANLFYLVVGSGALCLMVGLCMRWEKLEFKRPQEDDCQNTAAPENPRQEKAGKNTPVVV
ncbi:major facilitator superfamily transporter [Trichoderma velutinum]